MNSEEFVEAIKMVAAESAVAQVLQVLRRPPGRRSAAVDLDNARWYAALSDVDRQKLTELLKIAADRAVFGVLCVLDGVRPIEEGEDKGWFEVRYVKNGEAKALNSPNGNFLHDFY